MSSTNKTIKLLSSLLCSAPSLFGLGHRLFVVLILILIFILNIRGFSFSFCALALALVLVLAGNKRLRKEQARVGLVCVGKAVVVSYLSLTFVKPLERKKKLTPRNLKNTPLARCKPHPVYVHLHPPMRHIKHHVHALRVLGPLDPLGRNLHDARPNKRVAQQFGHFECRVLDGPRLDLVRCVRDFCLVSLLLWQQGRK